MTLKGQVQSLTSGQVRPRSRGDRNGSYCISVESPGRDERLTPIPLQESRTLLDQRLLANDSWWPRWPQKTFRGVGNANFYLNCQALYDTIPLKWGCAKVNITKLIFCPLTYNGDTAKMTWLEVINIKNQRCIKKTDVFYEGLAVFRARVIRYVLNL